MLTSIGAADAPHQGGPVTARPDLEACSVADLTAAVVHLEDLEVFVGQRSRMHPGPGWAVTLMMVRDDLACVQAELALRGVPSRAAHTLR